VLGLDASGVRQSQKCLDVWTQQASQRRDIVTRSKSRRSGSVSRDHDVGSLAASKRSGISGSSSLNKSSLQLGIHGVLSEPRSNCCSFSEH